jgi:hypothetical protein
VALGSPSTGNIHAISPGFRTPLVEMVIPDLAKSENITEERPNGRYCRASLPTSS